MHYDVTNLSNFVSFADLRSVLNNLEKSLNESLEKYVCSTNSQEKFTAGWYS